jgi:hypothetical protein
MMRCDKTGLTERDFKTILDVLNVYDPNDIVDHIPSMGTPEFMQDVQSAFKAVLAHVNRSKYGSDMGAFRESSNPKRHADKQEAPECTQLDEQDIKCLQAQSDDLDVQDYAEADKQRDAEEAELKKQAMDRLIHDMYINSLS